MSNVTLSSWCRILQPNIVHPCLWSIDSCQNNLSADQYHMTVSRAQVSTHGGYVFSGAYRWQVSSFQLIAGSTLIGFLYCNVLSLKGASPLASAKSIY